MRRLRILTTYGLVALALLLPATAQPQVPEAAPPEWAMAIDNVVSTRAGQVAAMWNHGRYMETKARRQSTPLPRLTGQELADIATYLAGLGSGPPKRQ